MTLTSPRQLGDAPFAPLRGLMTAVAVLVGLHGAISIATALTLATVSNGGTLTGDSLSGASASIVLVCSALLQPMLFIAAGVCFLVWLHGSYKNISVLNPDSLATPKGVVIRWFIPFVNLVHGYTSVAELYRCSEPPQSTDDPGFALRRSAPIVGFWWAAYLARNIIGRVLGNSEYTTPLVIVELLDVVAAALFIVVVARISKRQNASYSDLMLRRAAEIPLAPDRI